MKSKYILYILIWLGLSFNQNSYSQERNDIKNNLKQISDSLLILDIKAKSLQNRILDISKESKSDYSKNKKRLDKLSLEIQKNIESINQISNQSIKNKDDIRDLRVLIYDIEVDYNKLVNQLNDIEKFLQQAISDLDIVKQNQTAIYEEIEIINTKQKKIQTELNKIPELYFCRECNPKFSIGLGGSFFPTNIVDIPSSFAWSLDARYTYNDKINFIAEVNKPEVIIRSFENTQIDEYILDKWNITIYSLGANFNLLNIYNNNFVFAGSSSIFFANGKLDNFFNQNENNTLENINQNKFGLQLSFEIIYRDFVNKNPIEIYASLNSYISNGNILLTNSLGQNTDIGLLLPSIKTGVRFNFY